MDDLHLRDAAAAGLLGTLGRLLSLAHADRRPLGWSLLWELPTAIGMGVIGQGIGEYLHLAGFEAYATTIVVAYLGPRVIDVAVARWGR